MGWSRRNGEGTVGDNGSYDSAPTEALDTQKGAYAIDPATGQPELIGSGRTAVIGAEGVQRVVHYPETQDLLDKIVAQGDLTHGA